MRKIVTLSVGQCGNQVGQVFWERLAAEHGISMQGVLLHPDDPQVDNKDIFFYPADDGRYIPRAILIDLEPRVVKRANDGFYNPESTLMLGDTGAGNVWTYGYHAGTEQHTKLFDVIRREVETMDSLGGFMMTHSIGGGTGSGLGSYIIEKLTDYYPGATRLTYSVFPEISEQSHVVTQFYNSVLAIEKLVNFADGVVVLDNTKIYSILGTDKRSDTAANQLIASVMATATSTMRFPSHRLSSLNMILSMLAPIPKLHFLMTGQAPIIVDESVPVRKTSVIDIVSRLGDPKSAMMSAPVENGYHIAALNFIQGNIEPSEMQTALYQFRRSPFLRFVPWSFPSFNMVLARSSPYVAPKSRVSGLMLSNHTSIRFTLENIADNFYRPLSKGAFLKDYQESPEFGDRISDVFNEAYQLVRNTVSEYQRAETESYINEV